MHELDSHKGENGKLMIIAGSKRYHGAALLAILGARRFVDLVYFQPGENDSMLIAAVKSIPEVIVGPGDCDCTLFGNGIWKSKIRPPGGRLVMDGDGLRKKIPEGAVITPHEGEFRALFDMEGSVENVKKAASEHKITILKKGRADIVSNGEKTVTVKGGNPGLTKGGTGDVLAALAASFYCKRDAMDSCILASRIVKKAGDMLMKDHGYNYCATDLVDMLPRAYMKVVK